MVLTWTYTAQQIDNRKYKNIVFMYSQESTKNAKAPPKPAKGPPKRVTPAAAAATSVGAGAGGGSGGGGAGSVSAGAVSAAAKAAQQLIDAANAESTEKKQARRLLWLGGRGERCYCLYVYESSLCYLHMQNKNYITCRLFKMVVMLYMLNTTANADSRVVRSRPPLQARRDAEKKKFKQYLEILSRNRCALFIHSLLWLVLLGSQLHQ